jgi:hypothetical protein
MAGISPDVRVVLAGGDEWLAVTTFADTLAWESYAAAHNLELMSPMHMLGFYAWRDARKTGRCGQDVGLMEFAERIVSVVPQEADPVDPTGPVLGAG